MAKFFGRWFSWRACGLAMSSLVFLLSAIPVYGVPTGADGHEWIIVSDPYDPYFYPPLARGGSPGAACKESFSRYKPYPGMPPLEDLGISSFEEAWRDIADDEPPKDRPQYSCKTRIVYSPKNYSIWYEFLMRAKECANGYTAQPDGSCEPTRPPVQSCPVSHPVFPGSGVKILTERDDSGSAELSLTRTYRSNVLYGQKANQGQWLFEWQREIDTLAVDLSGKLSAPITVLRGDGDVRTLKKTGDKWGASGVADAVERLTDRSGVVTWRYMSDATGTIETYDSKGRLQNVRERGGRTTVLTYNAAGQLALVTAPSGRALKLDYDAQGHVANVTAPDGVVTKYAYYTNGMLSAVTWPDNVMRQYVYEDTRFPTALTGVIDEAGVRYATYAYDDQGRAIVSELTGGADRYQFQYGPDGQTTVLTPNGGSTVYSFLKQNGVLLPAGVSAPCPSCGKTSLQSEYDTNGNATREVGYDGAATTHTYDAQGRETQRVQAAGTPNAKTTTTEWHPTWNLPTRLASPAKVETFAYDANGNLVTYTEVGTADTNGSAGLAAAPDGPIKRTDRTYDSNGHVLTAAERTGNEVTATWAFVYNAQGDLQSLTNPEGKTGRIVQYDGAGRVLEAVDVNGVHLRFTYNARGWLTDYEFDGQHIRYEYDAIGQRTAVLGPQNLVTRYVYDAAHRLIEVLNNITLSEGDVQGSSISPFGAVQSELLMAQPTGLQALRDTVVHAWNSVIEWFKQWLNSIIASAHAQVGSGGMSSYRPPVPMPSRSPVMNQSPYPEDVIDSLASSVTRVINSAITNLADACTPGDPCEELQRQIREIAGKLETKVRQQLADKWNLFESAYSENPGGEIAGKGTWIGHDAQITGLKKGLARKVMEATISGCQVPPEVLRQIASPNPQRPVR